MHCTDISIMKSVCITYIPAAFFGLSDFYVTLHTHALCKDSDNSSKIYGFRNKCKCGRSIYENTAQQGINLPSELGETYGQLKKKDGLQASPTNQAPCTYGVYYTESSPHGWGPNIIGREPQCLHANPMFSALVCQCSSRRMSFPWFLQVLSYSPHTCSSQTQPFASVHTAAILPQKYQGSNLDVLRFSKHHLLGLPFLLHHQLGTDPAASASKAGHSKLLLFMPGTHGRGA